MVDGARGIEVVPADRRLRDGRMAQQLDAGTGPALAQEPKRGQRDEKVAQGATANDENFLHGKFLPGEWREAAGDPAFLHRLAKFVPMNEA